MSNAQKIPFAASLQNAMSNRIDDSLQGLGQVLPCSVTEVNGAIVTVNFDINNSVFTPPPAIVPTMGSRYLRLPIQIGDTGICVASNARLGGITGLGLGVAPLISPTNLGGLVFVPIGNVNWELVDADAVVISAPNGAVIQTEDEISQVIISEEQIALTFQGNSIVINSSGINIIGTLSLNGIPYLLHTHPVTTAPGETGGVVP